MTGVLICAGLLATMFIEPCRQEECAEEVKLREHIRSVIDLDGGKKNSATLAVGYNYYLLEQYAGSNGQTIDIRVGSGRENYLDSLKNGAVDMLAVAYCDSLQFDSLIVSHPIDSISVWLMRRSDLADMDNLNSWIDEWTASEEHEEIKNSYLNRYNVFRSRQRSTISPYDSLIRSEADSISIDWRMLAAVIYKESRFHIEARSPRGASGLMQMMPSTAANYGVTDPLDPKSNIQAGAKYLGRLLNRYRKVAADSDERFKFALAAYNAGEGRLDDILSLARYNQLDTSTWASVSSVIPQMNEESVMDTGAVRLGTFQGHETLAYVDDVIRIYEEFCRICPNG